MFKRVFDIFKDRFSESFKFATVISFFCILVFLILFLFDGLLQGAILNFIQNPFLGILYLVIVAFIISICLSLLSPFIYSYFASIDLLGSKLKDKITVKSFLKTYIIGLNRPYRGQLRVFFVCFTSILIYLGLTLVFALCFIGIFEATNAFNINVILDEFYTLFNNYIGSGGTIESMDALIDFVSSTSFLNVLNNVMFYTNYISLLFTFYYFFHSININTFRYFIVSSFPKVAPKAITILNRSVMQKERGNFLKGYYQSSFILTIIYVIAFTLSYFLIGLYVPNLMGDIYVLGLISFVICAIFLIPFMPLTFIYYGIYWNDSKTKYVTTFINFASKEINDFKTRTVLNSELEKKQVEEAEKNLNNLINNLNSDNKNEENNDQSNHKEDESKNDEDNKNS